MNFVTLLSCFHSFSLTMTKGNQCLPSFQMLAPIDLHTGALHTPLWTNRLIFKGFWNPDLFYLILTKRTYLFQNKKKWMKMKEEEKAIIAWSSADFCWLFLPSWCSTSPSPLNNSHWLQKQLLRKQEQWGLKGAVGGGSDPQERQGETEIHCTCQSSQIVCSRNPPNAADFYQGSGVAQKVRVSIWEGVFLLHRSFPGF